MVTSSNLSKVLFSHIQVSKPGSIKLWYRVQTSARYYSLTYRFQNWPRWQGGTEFKSRQGTILSHTGFKTGLDGKVVTSSNLGKVLFSHIQVSKPGSIKLWYRVQTSARYYSLTYRFQNWPRWQGGTEFKSRQGTILSHTGLKTGINQIVVPSSNLGKVLFSHIQVSKLASIKSWYRVQISARYYSLTYMF